MSRLGEESRQLGSKPLWLLGRLIPLSPLAFLDIGLVRGILFQLFTPPVLWGLNYAYAYGQADGDGISFRRFFREQ
jgi:hypothetical protein